MAENIPFLRLFVSLPLPPEVRAALKMAQAELAGLLPRGCLRLTRPDQFHLTLRFLGDVDIAAVPDLQKSLERACAGVAPIPLVAEKVGFFPPARSPRVIWAAVHDGTGRLRELAARIERAVAPFTTELAEKEFTGHVTLAHAQGVRRAEAERLGQWAEKLAARRFGAWTAVVVELIQSELRSSGAIHSALAGFPLVEKGVAAGRKQA